MNTELKFPACGVWRNGGSDCNTSTEGNALSWRCNSETTGGEGTASGHAVKDCREIRRQNMQQSKNWLSHVILGNDGLPGLCWAPTANSSGHGQILL